MLAGVPLAVFVAELPPSIYTVRLVLLAKTPQAWCHVFAEAPLVVENPLGTPGLINTVTGSPAAVPLKYNAK
jgi:hypothetical protein